MNDEFKRRLLAIPWQDRKMAVGDANGVPQALLDLCSPDTEVRKRAYWNLDNHIVVQSDLYEAAYDAIPFLLELVRDKQCFGRDLIYDLLIELASGYAPDDITIATISGEILPLRGACQMELAKGLETYQRDQSDNNAAISSRASQLANVLSGWNSEEARTK